MTANAYFQISVKDDGLYICLYPASPGGHSLTYYEVNIYLSGLKTEHLDKTMLKKALVRQTETVEIKLSDEKIPPVDEKLTVKITDDKMLATARAYPPSNDGKQLSRKDFIDKLAAAGVKFGIIDDAIDEWFQEKQYCTDIIVAEGIPAGDSKDASIEYYFKMDDSFRPATDENGNIDFHQLNLLELVEAGDILAVLTPAVEGKHGTNIAGDKIPSARPVKKRLTRGENMLLSEDKCILTAKVAGHVEMHLGRVVVHNVYTINGNVGTATGDVDYKGTVRVLGDVLTGYSVKATGDIYVSGVVEAASLTAGGKIVLTKGMHGEGKGSLSAGGNIIARFIQMSTVVSGGSVSSNSILHSKVIAKDSIMADFKPGLINGGTLTAKSLISARTVGSASTGSSTLLEVGAGPDEIEEYTNLENLLVEKRVEQRRLRLAAGPASKDSRSSTKRAIILEQLSAVDAEIEDLLDRYHQLKADIYLYSSGKITITDIIYEGAKVQISNSSYYVHDSIRSCQFVKKDASIEVLSY